MLVYYHKMVKRQADYMFCNICVTVICISKVISQRKAQMVMTILAALITAGWITAAVIGTQAYFMGEQSKPIHERNWRSSSFEQLARTFTGQETDYAVRVPIYSGDAYSSRILPKA